MPLVHNLFHVTLQVENKQTDIWRPCPRLELRIKSGLVIYAWAEVKLLEQSIQLIIHVNNSWTWDALGP